MAKQKTEKQTPVEIGEAADLVNVDLAHGIEDALVLEDGAVDFQRA